MFIKVKETEHDDELIINTNNICYIHPASNTILVNGIDGTGKGLIHLDRESMEKLLKYIDII